MKILVLLKNLIILVLMLLIEITNNFAQPDVLWTKTLGGNFEDIGECVQQTSDGGYIVVGYTAPNLKQRYVWLVKTDSEGNKIWDKTFMDFVHHWDSSVQQIQDGGYIIGGGGEDAWLIKTNESGDEVWTRIYGGSNYEFGRHSVQTSDSGYVLTGGISQNPVGSLNNITDVWLIKTNSSGDTIWTKTYGGSGWDHGISVQQTNDGGYIIAGQISPNSEEHSDLCLIKTDSTGNAEWTKIYGGKHIDRAESVQQTNDGGYIITGWTMSFGAGSSDIWFIKTDASGDSIWTKTFGGENFDKGDCVQQTLDSGYIIAGNTASFGKGGKDAWIIKTDSSGIKIWEKIIGGRYDDEAHYVQQTSDGGYIITGEFSKSRSSDSCELWLIRLSSEKEVSADKFKKIPLNFSLEQNYPNPFNSTTTITYHLPKEAIVNLSIYNVFGQLVESFVNNNKNPGSYSINFNASKFSSGVYFYTLKTGEYLETKKMLFLQ